MKASLVALAGFAAVTLAKQCQNLTIPVQIMARQGIFNVPNITTDEDATTLFQNYSNIMYGGNYTAAVTTGYQTVTGLYNISAKFCTPDNSNATNPVVQVLTHGIGFDKTYWDLSYNNFNYSYTDIATNAGYCTLAIDRLGIGNSSKADPYQIIQAPAEVGALYQINMMLRNGSLPGLSHVFGKGSIVNVGHSFGSQQSYMLSLMYPEATDALILTGFSLNGSFLDLGSFNAKIARLNQPLRFGSTSIQSLLESISANSSAISLSSIVQSLTSIASASNLTTSEISDIFRTTSLGDLIAGYNMTPPMTPQDLSTGYLTWSDAGANQYNFLYTPGLDPAVITLTESTKQPFTVGEILTLGGAPSTSMFTGPVQVVTGRQDAIYCGGDCLMTSGTNLTSIPAGVGMYFPESSNFSTYIPEDVGHAITVHYNGPSTYQEVQAFLMANDIVSS